MNYIGSKLSLLDDIRSVLREHGISGGTFCDLFSGTSIVAQMARQSGFSVIANDMQAYSLVMQRAFLETDGYPAFETLRRAVPAIDGLDAGTRRTGFGLGAEPGIESEPLRRVLAYLEALPGSGGNFYETYCEGGAAGRNYFSAENGRRLVAIREAIEGWTRAELIDSAERHVLLASLIETMDQLANTASVYGAFLKHVKKTALAPLVLRLPRLNPNAGPHRAFQLDANELVRQLAAEKRHDVLYLDPPYNHRQYHANYHLLETIARWDLDTFEPRGKTGLRPNAAQRSRFCSRRHVKAAFAELIAAADFKHLLVSYSNEGLLSEPELRELLEAKGACTFHKVAYKRFRADQTSETRQYKGDTTEEFLFYVEVR